MHTYYILLLTVYVLKGDRSKKEDKEEVKGASTKTNTE